MPITAHHSSSEGFVFFKHSLLASRAYPSQPRLASLPERPAALAAAHHRVAGAKGGHARVRGVGQDKIALARDRTGITQPASRQQTPRSQEVNSRNIRSHRRHTFNYRTATLTLHPNPILKAEIKRQAEIGGLSISAAGTALLEWAIRQKLHLQQAATLESAFESIITRSIGKRDARLAHLLVRIAFSAEQGRSLDSTILSRMPGMTPARLDQILDRSAQTAKSKITHNSPQLEDILKDLEEMLSQKEGRTGDS
jgi:hypothetical protein